MISSEHKLDWPSPFRAGAIEDAATRIHEQHGDEFAEAYRLACYVLESEISDGHGGGQLASAVEAFTEALEQA